LRNDLLDHLTIMNNDGLSQVKNGQPFWSDHTVGLFDFTFYPFFERFADVETYRDVEIAHGLMNLMVGQYAAGT